MDPIWGIDLGGTKIEGIILENAASLKVIDRLRIPTESHKGYRHILSQINKCVDQLRKNSGKEPGQVGIGTPGVLDPGRQTMKNCNTTVLNGRPLKKDLRKVLGIDVKLANDANCFAIAETMLGVVPDELNHPEVVFGVILGTGVGGGLVINNKSIYGKQGVGGEWGHMYLDESGGSCYCGNVGCVETIISGSALEGYYEKESGSRRTLKEIVERHHLGIDGAATLTIDRLIYFFGKGMANVINIIDPDAIVLGGGVGNIDLLYTEGVKMVRNFVFNDRLDTLFLKPKLGDSAGVFGAALL